jgi:sulfur carrier protein ThiS
VLALSRKVKIYSVGKRSELLSNRITEVEFEGETVKELLKSISSEGKSLYDEVVAADGSFSHGFAIALNGDLIRCEELDKKEIPDSSDVVVIHLLQIPAGG